MNRYVDNGLMLGAAKGQSYYDAYVERIESGVLIVIKIENVLKILMYCFLGF